MVDLHPVESLILTSFTSHETNTIDVQDEGQISADKLLSYPPTSFCDSTTGEMKTDYFDSLGVFVGEVDLFKSGEYFGETRTFKEENGIESENAIGSLDRETFGTASNDHSDIFRPEDFLNSPMASLSEKSETERPDEEISSQSSMIFQPQNLSSEADDAILGLEKEIFIKTEPDEMDDLSDFTQTKKTESHTKAHRKRPEDQIVPSRHQRSKKRRKNATVDLEVPPTDPPSVKTEDIELHDNVSVTTRDSETLEGISLYSDSEVESNNSETMVPPTRTVFVHYDFDPRQSLPSFQETFVPVLENLRRKERDGSSIPLCHSGSPLIFDRGSSSGSDKYRTQCAEQSLKSNISAAFAKFSGRGSTPPMFAVKREDRGDQPSMISSTLSHIIESHGKHSVDIANDIKHEPVTKPPKLTLTLESLKGAIPEFEFSRMQREHSRNVPMPESTFYPRDLPLKELSDMNSLEITNGYPYPMRQESHLDTERLLKTNRDRTMLHMQLMSRMVNNNNNNNNNNTTITNKVASDQLLATFENFAAHELFTTPTQFGRHAEQGNRLMRAKSQDHDLINSVLQATNGQQMHADMMPQAAGNTRTRMHDIPCSLDSQYILTSSESSGDWTKVTTSSAMMESPMKLSFNDLNIPYPFEDSFLCNNISNFGNFSQTGEPSQATPSFSDNLFSLAELNNAATFDLMS